MPIVADTVKIYVPTGVPLFPVGGALLLPPHEQTKMSRENNSKCPRFRNKRDRFGTIGRIKTPSTPTANGHVSDSKDLTEAELRAVVFTVTVIVEAVLALILAVAGTLQLMVVNAPVQLRLTVPLIPCPPRASE